MATLTALRRELKPVYAHYTDAVISMIGLEPHEKTLRAVKEGDLAEAHAIQVSLNKSHMTQDEAGWRDMFATIDDFMGTKKPAKKIEASDTLDREFSMQLWKKHADVRPVPSWFAKPLKPISRKCPEIEAGIQNQRVPDNYIFHFTHNGEVIGTAWAYVDNVRKVLVVSHLQQHTKGLPPAVTRKLEGWKNKAVEEIERITRENGLRTVFFSTAVHHSSKNVAPQPIHEELVETYGRLPMQHGYRLRQTREVNIRSFEGTKRTENLWWVKRV